MANTETLEDLANLVDEAEEIVAKREIKIDLQVDEKKTQEAMKDLENAFSGIRKKFESIGASIRKSLNDSIKNACSGVKAEMEAAFTITNPDEYAAAAARFGEGVAGALQAANENMNALEDSIVNTTAPVAGAVASMLNELLPPVIGMVNSLKQTISDAITGVQPLVTWLWGGFLQPVAQWTGGVIVETLRSLAGGLIDISNWIQENMSLVEGIVLVVGSIATAIGLVNAGMVITNGVIALWNSIGTIGAAVTTAFNAALAVLTSPITLVVAAVAALIATVVLLVKNWDTVKAVAISTWESIKEAFGSAWSWFKTKVVDPLVNGLKGGVNGIIGFINGLIAGLVKGINSLINVVNKLQFAVPDWIPGLGGKTFGFNLKPITAPQIPYLAKGAVLPANKPFLAMVGDQRHGEQGDCRRWREKGAERVAAVCVQRRRFAPRRTQGTATGWRECNEACECVQIITFLPAFLIRLA